MLQKTRGFTIRFCVLLSIIAMTLLSNCATVDGYPKDPQNNATLIALQTKYFGADAEQSYECIVQPAFPAGTSSGCLAQTDSNYAVLRRAKRDEIVLGRMRAYDIEFSDFQRALNGKATTLQWAPT